MRDLSLVEVDLISGGGNIWKDLFRPICVIAAGFFAGPGGAASALVILYGGEELYHSNAGNLWGEVHLPSDELVVSMMNNPYGYAD